MASCELCGRPASTKAKIEGTVLAVCANCASFGAEIKETKPMPRVTVTRTLSRSVPRTLKDELPQTFLIPDFGSVLRQARHKRGLTEEEAAKMLNIKESTLKHYEAGSVQPDDAAIKKLEKFYAVRLLATL